MLVTTTSESSTNVALARTETEAILGDSDTPSAVSEEANTLALAQASAPREGRAGRGAAAAAGGPPVPERPLPPKLYRFVEQHRTTVNAIIRSDPAVLESGFQFMTRAPRLIDFEFKVRDFRGRLPQGRTRGSQVNLHVNRQQCFQQSFTAMRGLSAEQMQGPLHVKFRDEEGADAGGLTREWFSIMGEEIVNSDYGLFIHSSEGMTFQPNPLSAMANENHLAFFRFVGRIVALAIYHDTPLDVHFTRSFYRHIIGVQPGLADMETIDPEVFKSLKQLLYMNLDEASFPLDFTLTVDRFGQMEEVELLPNGANIPVTEANKKEYIRLRCEYAMTTNIKSQLQEFLVGFYEIVPRHLIEKFTEQELELLVCGMPDIDVEDLRVNTDYQGFSASSPQIRWFWECVAGMTKQDRANLLQFATGCSKVPPGGFGNLEGLSGKTRFNITRVEMDPTLLPVAHTCFNRIDLPLYPSSDVLREKLMIAITFGNKGFTMM